MGILVAFSPNFFVPMVSQQGRDGNNLLNARENHWIDDVLGHLRPGVTPAQATADLNSIGAYLLRNYPKEETDGNFGIGHPGLGDLFNGAVRAFISGLMLLAGLILYVTYRVTESKPLLRRVTIPERALRHEALEPEFGSILVPVFGERLDDDIVQTAGRLAAEDKDGPGPGGSVIEAIWVAEVPLSLPLDAPLPDAQIQRGKDASVGSNGWHQRGAGGEWSRGPARPRHPVQRPDVGQRPHADPRDRARGLRAAGRPLHGRAFEGDRRRQPP